MIFFEHIQRFRVKKRRVRKDEPYVDIALCKLFDDLLKIVSYKRLTAGDIDCRYTAGRYLVNDMYAVFQRQLRVMRVGSGHKAVTAVEIALSGNAPMNAVNKSVWSRP